MQEDIPSPEQRHQHLLAREFSSVQLGQDRNNPVTLFYKSKGSGSNKIVFITGFLLRGDYWKKQTDYFEALGDYQTLELDNRGVGLSSCESSLLCGRYTTGMYAEDTIELIDFLGWEKFHLVAFSMGGMIGQEVAWRVPHRILSLCLISTHAGGLLWMTPLSGWSMMCKDSFVSRNLHEKTKVYMDMVFGPAVHENPELYKEFYEITYEQLKKYGSESMTTFSKQFTAVTTHYFTRRNFAVLRSATFPKLCITGNVDHLIRPSNSGYIAQQVQAKLVTLEGVGHGIAVQVPDQLNRMLQDFFESALQNKSK